MMNKRLFPHLTFTFSLTLLLFTGCIERELPVLGREANEVNLVEANVGVDYETQLFFSLQQNKVKSSCKQSEWCIALKEAGTHVEMSLNSGRAMKSINLGFEDFFVDVDVSAWTADDWEVMDPRGTGPNVTEGLKLIKSELMFLDLGLDENNDPLGIVRLSLIEDEDGHWRLRVANAEGDDPQTVLVPRLDGYEWHQVSLLNRTANQIEPQTQEWDVCITQYMELLDEEIPYLVVGILTPTERVQVFETSNVDWEVWKTNSWEDLDFSSEWNAIGFDWKTFDLSTSSYTVDFDRLYCIKTEEGREFIMRMLDFYDAEGNTGNVTFEVLER